MTVNGEKVCGEVEGRTLLVEFIRNTLGKTGTHVGCDTSQCGACVVHVNGKAIKSCTALAIACDGADVTTIEGIASNGKLHPMQEAFREQSRAAVRLLHPGHDHGWHRYREAQGQEAQGRDDPRRAGRQHLPLHRLPQHREGHPGRRHPRCEAVPGLPAARVPRPVQAKLPDTRNSEGNVS
jgi:hypothetical protein